MTYDLARLVAKNTMFSMAKIVCLLHESLFAVAAHVLEDRWLSESHKGKI